MEKRYTQEISNHLNQSVFHRGMFHVIHKINFKECFYRGKSITPFGYVLDILPQWNGMAWWKKSRFDIKERSQNLFLSQNYSKGNLTHH